MVWPCQKDARGENTKINYGIDTMGEKEKRTSKKNVDGKRTSSHDNKKLRTRSMEKERGSVMFSFCRLLKFPLTFYYKLTSHDSSVDIETGYRLTNRIVTAGLWSPMA